MAFRYMGAGEQKSGHRKHQGTERAYDVQTGRLHGDFAGAYGNMARGVGQRAGPEFDVSLFEEAARGEAPSAAMQQQRSGLDSILAAQMAARASMRGGRVGASDRLVANSANQAQMASAGQAAELRANEMMGARGQLAQAYASRAQVDLEAQRQRDHMVQYYTGLGHSLDEANRQADMDMARLQAEVGLGEMADATQKHGATMGMVGTGISAGGEIIGSLYGASDVRAKQNIKKADKQVTALLDGLKAYEFDYKDKKHGGDKNLGIMAQDLEKSDLGRQMVVDGPVKMVDLRRALMAGLAANASLHKRLKKVEGK